MLHFHFQRNDILIVPGNKLKIFADVETELVCLLLVLGLDEPAEHEEAVVQKMRINLRLQPLQLGALVTYLLFIILFD